MPDANALTVERLRVLAEESRLRVQRMRKAQRQFGASTDGTDKIVDQECAFFEDIALALDALPALLRFAGHAIDEAHRENIGDWDGGDLEETMVACGLLEPVEVSESCGENCPCGEFGFPTTCMRQTPLAKAALAAVPGGKDG